MLLSPRLRFRFRIIGTWDFLSKICQLLLLGLYDLGEGVPELWDCDGAVPRDIFAVIYRLFAASACLLTFIPSSTARDQTILCNHTMRAIGVVQHFRECICMTACLQPAGLCGRVSNVKTMLIAFNVFIRSCELAVSQMLCFMCTQFCQVRKNEVQRPSSLETFDGKLGIVFPSVSHGHQFHQPSRSYIVLCEGQLFTDD